MFDINTITNELDSISTTQSCICKPERCSELLNKKSVNILHINIRSVNHNFDEFTVLLSNLSIIPEIIVLSECWLSKAPTHPTLSGYVGYHTLKNTNQNDGVIVFVKTSITHIVTESHVQDANCLICKIESLNLVIVALYRPPCNRNIDNFLDSLENTLASLSSYKNVVLLGDININIIPAQLNSMANDYLNLAALHGLLPTHNLPTRDKSCLDHVLLKSSLRTSTLIIESSITDHLPVLFSMETTLRPNKRKSHFVKVDYDSVYADVTKTDFTQLLNTSDPNVAAEILITSVGSIIQMHSRIIRPPSKLVIFKPWITIGLLRCIRNRDSMSKQLKINPDNYTLKITFLRYRNFCNKLLKRLKHNFENNELRKARKNPRSTWKIVKNITCTESIKQSPVELLNIDRDNLKSVNLVNEYFSRIGSDLAVQIDPNIQNYQLPSDNINANSFVLLPTDESEVDVVIKSLRKDAAVGWDAIPAHLLQRCSKTLVPILTHICNISMAEGIFPKSFKRAVVHPIFKSGDRDSVNNYRPISVLPALSKILEKLLDTRLRNFLQKNSILAPNQFGFRVGISTEDAVASLVDQIVNTLDSGQKCLSIFLDLTKAFDTVSVPHLLLKMERMGIRGYALRIFKDYLSSRTQCVKIDNFVSDNAPLSFGVPQGSILGPTLFLLYINSLCTLSLPFSSIFTYADDTAILVSGDNWTEVFTCAESALSLVMQWLSNNLLTLNLKKTTYITFSMTAVTQPSLETFNIRAHTCTTFASTHTCVCPSILRSDHTKYLGVFIDSFMSWKHQLNNITSRVRKMIYIFKKLRNSADLDTLKLVYYSLCQSILTYCVTVWGGAVKSCFLPLERAQRAVLKVMTFKPFRYSTAQLYHECKLLTVRQLFVLETICRKHASLKFTIPVTNRRRPPKICQAQRYRSALAARNYSIIGCHLYNTANEQCNIYSVTRSKCKKKVTLWLLSKSYEETEKLIKLS